MSGFFSRSLAKDLWRTVSGVSNAGRKRGRGKGTDKAKIKNFNIGQTIGIGRKKIVAEGLNMKVGQSPKLQVEEIADNTMEFETNKLDAFKSQRVRSKFVPKPIDRGWSGKRSHGKKSGQPEGPSEFDEEAFKGFDSTVLMLRPLFGMGPRGRTKRSHALVVTGNKKGLAGFSTAVGNAPSSTVRRARNRAAQCLVHLPLYDNQTVLHNFFSRYHATTVFVERKPKGFGIRAHRIIKAICEEVGITDLYAKVEGSTSNQINLTKAFFLGLMNQKSYQSLADERQLHLVELRNENFNYPKILASPSGEVRNESDIKAKNENLDFTYYINGGKIKSVKVKRPSPFLNHPTYYKHLDRLDITKNREKTRIMLAAKYGDKKVLDVFPHFISKAGFFYKQPKD